MCQALYVLDPSFPNLGSGLDYTPGCYPYLAALSTGFSTSLEVLDVMPGVGDPFLGPRSQEQVHSSILPANFKLSVLCMEPQQRIYTQCLRTLPIACRSLIGPGSGSSLMDAFQGHAYILSEGWIIPRMPVEWLKIITICAAIQPGCCKNGAF